MAGRAGWRSGVILSYDPGFRVEIHFGDFGAELNPVLGFRVNLDLRMIRTHMALPAVLRLARQRGTETVPAVACGAGAPAAVGVDAADAAVRPRGGIKFAVPQVFHFAAVALTAAVRGSGTAFDDFPEHVVERADEFRGRGMVAFFKLRDFAGVAARAVIRRDDDGDALAVMIERRRIIGRCLMAGIAVHTFPGMRAGLPLLHDPRRRAGMAIQAFLSIRRDGWNLSV